MCVRARKRERAVEQLGCAAIRWCGRSGLQQFQPHKFIYQEISQDEPRECQGVLVSPRGFEATQLVLRLGRGPIERTLLASESLFARARTDRGVAGLKSASQGEDHVASNPVNFVEF